jgi:hypothetical protein
MVQNECAVQNASTTRLESLSGLIERVTFFNEDSGFGVLKVKAKGHRDLVTVVGSLPSVSAGEWLTAQGRWVQGREYGQQFRAEMLTSTPPTTKEGIEKYLGSGMVKGIGPVCAKKLVDKFGEGVFDIIEKASARLEDVDGIGPKRRKRIKGSWDEQKVIRDIMVFLHSNGVSTSRAVRIHKTYGEDAIEKVRSDALDQPELLGAGQHKTSGLLGRIQYFPQVGKQARAILDFVQNGSVLVLPEKTARILRRQFAGVGIFQRNAGLVRKHGAGQGRFAGLPGAGDGQSGTTPRQHAHQRLDFTFDHAKKHPPLRLIINWIYNRT